MAGVRPDSTGPVQAPLGADIEHSQCCRPHSRSQRSNSVIDRLCRITGELAGVAEHTMREATAVIRTARGALHTATGQRKGRLRRAVTALNTLIGPHRTCCRPDPFPVGRGDARIGHPVVSLHDIDARPIRKGRLGKPVKVGHKPNATTVEHRGGPQMRICGQPQPTVFDIHGERVRRRPGTHPSHWTPAGPSRICPAAGIQRAHRRSRPATRLWPISTGTRTGEFGSR